MKEDKTCSKCALANNSICIRTKLPIRNPAQESCSNFTTNLQVCWKCGGIIPKESVIYDQYKNACICPNCFSLYETCYMCKAFGDGKTSCAFLMDNTLPKQVQKKIQQGPMISVTVVKNPELIEKTCKKGCCCWSETNGCLRETSQTCINYKEQE